MSHYNRYQSFDISSNATVFEFISTGPKGEIKKIIQFSPTRRKEIFNLAFGNLRDDGTIDDTATNDNKDRDKILATVAAAVFDFTERYPSSYIFFTGSSKERTRLYRMAISLNYEELVQTFDIWGLKDEGEFEVFEKHRNYSGFLIIRK
jgi:hypothetical protein